MILNAKTQSFREEEEEEEEEVSNAKETRLKYIASGPRTPPLLL